MKGIGVLLRATVEATKQLQKGRESLYLDQQQASAVANMECGPLKVKKMRY